MQLARKRRFLGGYGMPLVLAQRPIRTSWTRKRNNQVEHYCCAVDCGRLIWSPSLHGPFSPAESKTERRCTADTWPPLWISTLLATRPKEMPTACRLRRALSADQQMSQCAAAHSGLQRRTQCCWLLVGRSTRFRAPPLVSITSSLVHRAMRPPLRSHQPAPADP